MIDGGGMGERGRNGMCARRIEREREEIVSKRERVLVKEEESMEATWQNDHDDILMCTAHTHTQINE